MGHLTDLHMLCTQIHRWQCMQAIAGELRDRYPELGPVFGDMVGTGAVYADILIRRELATSGETWTRTADFAVIPDRLRRRFQLLPDYVLPQIYVRYELAGAAAAAAGPASLRELLSDRPPPTS